MAEFVGTIGRVAQPSYLPYAFFIEGGGLAVENALKVAFDWKAKKNMQDGKKSPSNLVIHLKDCFHGRTGYTMSLTDSPDPRKVQHFPKFAWPRVINPSIKFPINEKSIEDLVRLEDKSISQIKEVLLENPDDVACMILEPIQGEGGDNHFRPEYFKMVKELSLENDFLLIYDEVQTGVGITGKMWAHQHFREVDCSPECISHCKSMEPDVISFGKKTQCCGIFAGDRINEIERIRISSIEPNLITDEIIEFCNSSNKFMPHFHIPLQSGSNKILRAMRRRYGKEVYRDRIKKIKDINPETCIGADVIVGFPGESYEDFLETYNFINDLDIAYLHVFTYSERKGTEAVKLGGEVQKKDRSERSKMLHILSEKKKRNFNNNFMNTKRPVLFEGIKNGYLIGYTDNYIKAQVKSPTNYHNQIVEINLIENKGSHIIGSV